MTDQDQQQKTENKIEELFVRYGKENPAVKLAELIINRSILKAFADAGFMDELIERAEIDWDAVEELAEHLK
jgi:hypothetical protein